MNDQDTSNDAVSERALRNLFRFGLALLMCLVLAPSFSWANDPHLLVSLMFFPQTVRAGAPTMGTATLQAPAPPNGRVLYLSSSHPYLIPVPASVVVPGGTVEATFRLQTNGAPGATGEVTISVSTKPPISARFGMKTPSLLSRGIEESSQLVPSEHQAEPQPPSVPPDAGLQSADESPDNPREGEEVLERSAPTATMRQGLALQLNPRPAEKTDPPSDTKSAVIFVQLPLGLPLPGTR